MWEVLVWLAFIAGTYAWKRLRKAPPQAEASANDSPTESARKLLGSFRTARIIRTAMVAAGILQAGVAEQVVSQSTERPELDPLFLMVFAFLGVAEAGVCLGWHYWKVRPTSEALHRKLDDGSALAQWHAGQIITAAIAMSVVLFGVVLRFLGADFEQVLWFYGTGTLLQVVLMPTRESLPVEEAERRLSLSRAHTAG